jgi:hypothetical protein
MSDLLNKASLVVIPSGYKEDTVYSVVPSDGSGDLSFTRASNGTRVNSAGLVEVCPWNLVEQSNTFSNAAWVKSSCTLTSGQNDPNGGTNGWRYLSSVASSGYAYQDGVLQNGVQYTFYIYAKSNTGSNQTMYFTANSGSFTSPAFTLTSTWQLCSWTFTANSIGSNILFGYNPSATLDLLVYGAQLNIGSTAKPYFPTTDRLNVPRLTYQNGGGGCPSLLLEKQSTNLVVQSQALTISTVNVGYTATDNNATSPDGTQNASRVLEDSSTLHLIQKPYSVGSTTDYYTASFFVKSISRAKGSIIYGLDGAPYNSIGANFDLTAQTITSPTASGSGAVAGSSKIENFGNGWFRISVSGIVGVSGTHYTRLVGQNDSGSDTYTGDPSKGFYAWGFQGEAGTYPTSYIPTTSASATRVADACFKTSATALIGQTEGTMFGEIEVILGTTNMLGWIRKLSGGIYSDTILTYVSSTGLPSAGVSVGGVDQVAINGTTSLSAGYHKIAFAYKANDFVLYVNGVQVASDTSGSVPTCDELYIDQYIDGGLRNATKKEFVLFKTRLTNAELAQLTA